MRLLLLLLVALAGCAGPNLDVDPFLILGTGETEFVPLTGAVDDLPIAFGIQGGEHVWGAVRATGMDWTNLTIIWELLDADDDPVTGTTTIRQSLSHCTRSDGGCEGGMGEIVAVTVILDDANAVRGDELTMVVTASDEDGREATASSQIRPVLEIDTN